MKKLSLLLLAMVLSITSINAGQHHKSMIVGGLLRLEFSYLTFLYPYVCSYVWSVPSPGLYTISGGTGYDYCTIGANLPTIGNNYYTVECRVYEKEPGAIVKTLAFIESFYITVESNNTGNGNGEYFYLDVFETIPTESATNVPIDTEIIYKCNNEISATYYDPYKFAYIVSESGDKVYPRTSKYSHQVKSDGSKYTIFTYLTFDKQFEPNTLYTLILPVGSTFNTDGACNSNEFRLNFTTGTSTNISTVTNSDIPFDVYDLNGRKVRTYVRSTEGLPKGVYIINKQKVIVP